MPLTSRRAPGAVGEDRAIQAPVLAGRTGRRTSVTVGPARHSL